MRRPSPRRKLPQISRGFGETGRGDCPLLQIARRHAGFPPQTIETTQTSRFAPPTIAQKTRSLDDRGRSATPRSARDADHWITSSARSSSDRGIVIPSDFAVLPLITNSKRLGCWTGMSAGFAPFSILSTYSAAK